MTYPTLVVNPNLVESQILNLTNKFKELAVQITNSKDKKDQLVNDRANIWCTNCKDTF